MLSKEIENIKIQKEIHKELESCNIAIFTGSGISVDQPAGFPFANKITEVMLNKLIERSKLDSKTKGLEIYNAIYGKIQMERLWESVDRATNTEIIKTLVQLQQGRPNLNHYAIIILCKKFHINRLYTLNFDNYLELAIKDIYKSNVIEQKTDKQYISSFKFSDNKVLEIVHLHGQFIDGDVKTLATTISTTGYALESDKESMFVESISGKSILCLGYSNQDYDTFPLIYKNCTNIYWYIHNTIPPAIIDKCNENPKKFHLYYNIGNKGIMGLLDNFLDDSVGWLEVIGSISLKPEVNMEKILGEFQEAFDNKLGDDEKIKEVSALVTFMTLFHDIGYNDLAVKIQGELSHRKIPAEIYANFTNQITKSGISHRERKYISEFFYALKAYKSSKSDYNLLSVVKVLIIFWKICPAFFFIRLVSEHIINNIIRRGEPNSIQAGYYILGDIHHYLAEVVYCPSSFVIYHSSDKIINTISPLLRFLDKQLKPIFYKKRKAELEMANRFYENCYTYPYTTAEKGNITYNLLSGVRRAETQSAIGINIFDDLLMKTIEASKVFYNQQKDQVGMANNLVSKAIIDFYSGKLDNSKEDLLAVREMYPPYSSGKKKASSFIFRIDSLLHNQKNYKE